MDDRTRTAVAPSRALASWVAGLFALSTLGTVVSTRSGVQEIRSLQGLPGDERMPAPPQPEWLLGVNLVSALLSALLVVLFLVWFHAAYGAAVAHRTAAGSPGRVTAGWLVPVLNLVLCLGPVRAVWDAGRRDGQPERRGLLLAWWASGCATVGAIVVASGIGIITVIGTVDDLVTASNAGQDPAAAVVLVDVGIRRIGATIGLATGLLTTAAAIGCALFVVSATDRLRTGSALARLTSGWSPVEALAVVSTGALGIVSVGTLLGLA